MSGGADPAELRVQILDDAAVIPARAHADDAGYDLVSVEHAELAPGDRARIRTGVAFELPSGYVGLVCPRSGLADRHGIALVNAPGVIDAGYRGEVQVLLWNTDRSESFVVEPGMRIAQLVIVPHLSAQVRPVAELTPATRGSAGFGSTGTGTVPPR